jgi:plastocyanin
MMILFTPKYRLWSLWFVLALFIGTTFLVACGGGATTASSPPAGTTTTPATTPQTVQVKIVEKNNQYSFAPATITITKGTKVTWTNGSDAPHTVTSDTNAFNTPSNLTQNQTFSMTFTTAGTYTYHCAIHSYMKGSITVTS